MKALYPTLKVSQLLNFKNDVDDIVGFELDEFIFYLRHIHQAGKTKLKYSHEELYSKVLPAYAELASRMREEGRDNYYLRDEETGRDYYSMVIIFRERRFHRDES